MEHTELFAFMRENDFADALAVLKSESPHTLSVVLSCMEAVLAAAVLQALGAEAQNAVVPLIAEGERIPRAVAESIACDIEEKLRAEQKRHCFSIGGAERLGLGRYITQADGTDFMGLYGFHVRVRNKEIED